MKPGALCRIREHRCQKCREDDEDEPELLRRGSAIALSQRKFIVSLPQQYGTQNNKPVATPFNEKNPLVPSTTTAAPPECKLHQEKVGKVTWLMVATRGDISYTAIQLAKYARNPGPQHEQALKRLFRYLVGTIDLCIWSNKEDESCLSPSNCHCMATVMPITLDPIRQMGCQHLVSSFIWQVVLSRGRPKSNIVLLCQLNSQGCFPRLYLHEHALLYKPVAIHADNTGAIALAKNPEYHARTKHGLLNRNGLVKRRNGVDRV
ncbi:Reverse transcriptase RNA-dependent DNA polymerase [Penicillium sp. CMV-2018d]|nr:Reverse transcriptase RNA-dependent DNA polymerase [Penicillium sp. CMV-2018d]